MKGIDEDRYMSIREVAQFYGKSEAQVRYAIKTNRGNIFRPRKMGWVWVFKESELPDKWVWDK